MFGLRGLGFRVRSAAYGALEFRVFSSVSCACK